MVALKQSRPSVPVIAGELVGCAVHATESGIAVVLVLAAGAVPRAVASLPSADDGLAVWTRQLPPTWAVVAS